MSNIINTQADINQITKRILKSNSVTKPKTHKNLNIKDLIANTYVILKLIGAGSFGKIYLSYNLRDNIEVIVKKEIKPLLNEKKPPQLKIESKIYTSLLNISTKQDLSGNIALPQNSVIGIPKFYGMGMLKDNSGYYMITEFLGPNLIELFKYCSMNKFTLSTVCLLAIQMLNRIEYIHNYGFIHRDIKPENFLIGHKNNGNVIHLIDFGLSKRYIMKKNNQHIPYREGRNLIGTARYISINTHLGIEQSRRDDLESIGYVLILFLKGSLPWQGMRDHEIGISEKFRKIMEKKLQIPVEILCLNLPIEMVFYFKYVKSLRFESKPDYDLLRGFFINMLSTCQVVYDLDKDYLKFDWTFDDINHIWDKYRTKGADCSNHHLNSPRGFSMCSSNDNYIKVSMSNKSINKNYFKININNSNNNSINNNNHHHIQISNISNNKIIKDIKKKVKFSVSQKSNENLSHHEIGSIESSESNASKESKNISSISETSSSNSNDDTIKMDFNSYKFYNIKTINNINFNDEEIDYKIKKIMKKNVSSPIRTARLNQEHEPIISIDNNIIELKKLKKEKLSKNKSHKDLNDINILNKNRLSFDLVNLNQILTPKMGCRRLKSTKFLGLKLNSSEFLIPKKHSISGNENLLKARRKSKQILDEELSEAKFIKFYLSREKLLEIKKEELNDHYEILENLELDESLGIYKRVLHKKLGQYRSMKIINKTKYNKKEIEIIQKLSHPNILQIFEIFDDENNYYIICENIEGKPLFEYIVNDNSFHEKEVCQVMKEILLTVNYLHSLNIMHRDLKPESIVIKKLENNTYKIKFVNFSTATEFIEGKQLTQFVGTHYYVAPEVITKNYNELCDIWSCGIIMYILICEYPPFQGKNNDEILHNIRFTELKFKKNEWAHISNSCKDLIRKMLSKNPKKRPSADICLKHRWFKGLTQIVNDLSTINQIKAVHKMAGFIKGNKFKQAVLQFMVNHFDLKHEEKKLNVIFNKFDVNNTGKVTKKNFLNELIKIYGEKDANNLTNKIFGSIDLDGNGDISYNEFLTAIMDSKKLMTDDKLEKTFKLIDKNEDGKISIEEIKNLFGGNVKQWKKMINELDNNIKNEIDLDEFKKIMINSDKNVDEGSFESESVDEEDLMFENIEELEEINDDDNINKKKEN